MISIFTPVHFKAVPYVKDAYLSLVAQTFTDWEWSVVLNDGGHLPVEALKDPRVKVIRTTDDDDGTEVNSIGRLKKEACDQCTGDIYVELDADDMLTPNALQVIHDTFADGTVAMAYSNSADFKNSSWESMTYSEAFGWRSRPFFHGEHELIETIAWPASPHMMRQIFWAPNHVRAWRATAYKALNGHDPLIKTGDDHDLCCRTYIAYGSNGVRHIDKCLYLYRQHDENSCVTDNAEVQRQTERNYMRYSRDMMARWAKDLELDLLDTSADRWPGFELAVIDADGKFLYEDNSVGVLRITQNLAFMDPVRTMNEAYRVLAPGGWLLLEVLSTDGRGAFQNPLNKAFWDENSIWNYTTAEFAKTVPSFKGRFQDSRTITYCPTEFHQRHGMPVLQADLIALKGAYAKRPVGPVNI